jgi:hypothetical protein
MFTRKADAPLMVQVPTAAQDRPSWMKVGVITALGFIVGVAWPRLAGVRLGPAVPESAVASSSSTAAPPEPSPAPGAPASAAIPAAPAAVSTPSVAAVAPAATAGGPSAPAASGSAPVSVSVGHGAVFACTTTDGDALKGNACGTLAGLDSVVMPRLRRLADCPDAASANGKLHLNVRVDFARSALGVELGRTRGVTPAEPLLACAKAALSGASAGTSNISHENARYSVAYTVTFGGAAASAASAGPAGRGVDGAPPPPPAPPPAAAPVSGADGEAQVAYETAIVRDAPRTGKVVARLPRGTTVHLGAAKEGWYPIKYGDGYASDGWIYRGAIGR